MKKQCTVFLIFAALCSAPGCDGAFADLYNSIINEDTVAPQQVVMTRINEGEYQILFEWTDPGDSDFDHIEISRIGVTGSTVIAKGSEEFIQGGLTSDTEYTFKIRTVDVVGNISSPVIINVSTSDKGDMQLLYTADALDTVRDNRTDNCALLADIDLSEYSEGEGWDPIGVYGDPYNGTFNGNGHTISDMTINRPGALYQGLFASLGPSAEVRDLKLTGVEVHGLRFTGSLVGYNAGGSISNCSAVVNVVGEGNNTGGLVGYNYIGVITDCHAEGEVTGYGNNTGGLVGWNLSNGSIVNCSAIGVVNGVTYTGGMVGYSSHDGTATIINCHAAAEVKGSGANTGGLIGYNQLSGNISGCSATGHVEGTGNVGGLLGAKYGTGEISGCHAEGSVTGTTNSIGGLVGYHNSGNVIKSYATGDVDDGESTTVENVGGLVGVSYSGITDCYATGSVTGYDDVGGLVGENSTSGSIINCYATGAVNGTSDLGGLIGNNEGTSASNCFYDRVETGYIPGSWTEEGMATYTIDMKRVITFSSVWDFTTPVWAIDSEVPLLNEGYPYLVDTPPVE